MIAEAAVLSKVDSRRRSMSAGRSRSEVSGRSDHDLARTPMDPNPTRPIPARPRRLAIWEICVLVGGDRGRVLAVRRSEIRGEPGLSP